MTLETFFVTYNTGEYDSYYEHVYAIDAESKEALYVEIHDAFDAYVSYQTKYQEERNKIDAQYRPKSSSAGEKQFKLYHEKLKEFYEEWPCASDFIVFGYTIPPFDEAMICEKDDAFEKAGLEIHSVSEYIESVRPVRAY